MDRHAAAKPMSKQDDDLMQLTLQLKNKKGNDEKYAKFHGDNLIGVSEMHMCLTSANNDLHRIISFPRLACGKI